MDLFEQSSRKATLKTEPLAERMRPKCLRDYIGQAHIAGDGTLIRNAIENDRIFSMVLWGPPGCGKTTLATIIARETQAHFIQLSAVLSGVKQIREVIDDAKNQLTIHRKRTILFVDEIHRFNKAQQDAFLPHVESGLITLIGATTENPSFRVIPALMSRCRIVTLNSLTEEEMVTILEMAIRDEERGLGKSGLSFSKDALFHIVALSDGDVRSALNGLDIIVFQVKTEGREAEDTTGEITLEEVENILQKKSLFYDKSGDEHFNLLSAFHKSLRGSDPDAALYWVCRMLESGEDPLVPIRRMIAFASEDVGVADPNALTVALNALEAFQFMGFPEGELAIAEAVVYLATAPKSNSVYRALKEVKGLIHETGSLPVPLHIRNAPTKLMKDLGYKSGYKYAHDYKEGYAPQSYLPEKIDGKYFYSPSIRGYEKLVKQRLDKWRELKRDHETSRVGTSQKE